MCQTITSFTDHFLLLHHYLSHSYGGNPDLYFYGYVYTGNLSISSHGSSDTKVIPGVAFTIAEETGDLFICNQDKKIDGIWGIAFTKAEDGGYVMMPGFNNPSDVQSVYNNPNPEEWCFNKKSNSSYFPLEPVIMKALELKNEYISQQDSSLFGICLTTPLSDLSTLMNSPITYNAAVAFGGSDAIKNNPCYNQEAIDATVVSDSNGAFWTLPITSMQVFCGSLSDPVVPFGPPACPFDSPFLDSGTPQLVLPPSIVDEITSCSETDGSLHIQLEGGELIMDLSDLQYLEKNNFIQGASEGELIILGFPIFFFYYILFDYGDGVEGQAKISFVKN